MTKSAHPDQTAQNTKSDQGLHALLTEICIRNEIKLKKAKKNKNKTKTPPPPKNKTKQKTKKKKQKKTRRKWTSPLCKEGL